MQPLWNPESPTPWIFLLACCATGLLEVTTAAPASDTTLRVNGAQLSWIPSTDLLRQKKNASHFRI